MLMPFCMPARLTDKDDSRAERERKTMKDKIFGVLQRIGRSFMLPIAVLPVAGLLLGIGSSFTNETMIALMACRAFWAMAQCFTACSRSCPRPAAPSLTTFR